MDYILKNLKKTKFGTKDILKIIGYIFIGLLIVLVFIAVKYKPVYEVSFNGETIGYVESKTKMEDIIKSEVLVSKDPCAVFTTLNQEPVYELKLVNIDATNEYEIAEKLNKETTTMYKIYSINMNEEVKSYVNTWEEAEQIVNEMKEEYSDLTEEDVNITVNEKYTENISEIEISQLADAESSIDNELRVIQDEKEKIAAATCNGVYFSVKPVSGNITSRFGVNESVRNHTHKGMDIAAPAGTPIKVVAPGTVSYSGWMSGYGNFIIVDHENGVQTCYGHCSKLYVSKGETVEAGDTIAAVGSTGNSTGNHLHFEVRVDGEKINPQNYLYK